MDGTKRRQNERDSSIWFRHVQMRPIDAVRKSDSLDVTGTSRGRRRLKKTYIEMVRNDPKALTFIWIRLNGNLRFMQPTPVN